MFLAVATRPDIACTVKCGQSEAGKFHCSRLEQSKAYFFMSVWNKLHGNQIGYKKGQENGIQEAYCDADYAGDLETRISTFGALNKFADGAITWMSQKQKYVSLSSMASEFIAANEAVKEVILLKWLLGEITQSIEDPVLKVDNANCIMLAKNAEFHRR